MGHWSKSRFMYNNVRCRTYHHVVVVYQLVVVYHHVQKVRSTAELVLLPAGLLTGGSLPGALATPRARSLTLWAWTPGNLERLQVGQFCLSGGTRCAVRQVRFHLSPGFIP